MRKKGVSVPSPLLCSSTGAEPQAGWDRSQFLGCLSAEWAGNATAVCALDTLASQPFWTVSVNLQERKELGEDLLCTWGSSQLLSHLRLAVHFLKRKELCTAAESAPGSANYTSVTQGETSAKANVTDVHKSSWTAQLLCLFPALEIVWIKWTLQNSGASRGVTVQLWHLYEHNSIPNSVSELFRSDWATLRAVWAGESCMLERSWGAASRALPLCSPTRHLNHIR